MEAKFGNSMLQRFVTSNTLRIEKFVEDGKLLLRTEEGNPAWPLAPKVTQWMHHSNCNPTYRGLYYTPPIQSSAPAYGGGSSNDGGYDEEDADVFEDNEGANDEACDG